MSGRTKASIIIAAVVLIAGAVVFFWAGSSNQGTVYETAPRAASSEPATNLFDGTYIAFEYSSRYDVERLPAGGDDLELYRLSANTNFDKRLAVAVSRLPGGQLQQNSAYVLRSTATSDYASQEVTLADGSVATVFTKMDNLERTAFIKKGERVAVLAFTTTGNLDNLEPEVDAVLQTFRWKQ